MSTSDWEAEQEAAYDAARLAEEVAARQTSPQKAEAKRLKAFAVNRIREKAQTHNDKPIYKAQFIRLMIEKTNKRFANAFPHLGVVITRSDVCSPLFQSQTLDNDIQMAAIPEVEHEQDLSMDDEPLDVGKSTDFSSSPLLRGKRCSSESATPSPDLSAAKRRRVGGQFQSMAEEVEIIMRSISNKRSRSDDSDPPAASKRRRLQRTDFSMLSDEEDSLMADFF
ncbi:hypothetical protein QBC35DRAFT_449552 [Podospora australis]|uniref:Uncharacterized protein n=1 Tax=Podospora australis TaxID=1536484 RepID=A0AAN6WZK0_9PEZI|nr:hypothetical protein QBC35DRAFT_449552 [Podospora australis]